MGRTKKNEQANENEAPQFMPPVDENNEDALPDGVEEVGDNVVPLFTSEDVVLKTGRVVLPTGARVEKVNAMVVSTADNAVHGFCVEDGKRLENSFVVAMAIAPNNDVAVVVDVRDDVSILRQTQYGTRMDNLVIAAGTHVADLVLL